MDILEKHGACAAGETRAPIRLVYDIETDGFKPSRIHSLVMADADTGDLYSFADQPGYPAISMGLEILAGADEVIGHNIISFDNRVIRKLHGIQFRADRVIDTLTLARVLWPDLQEADAMCAGMPSTLHGRHSLEAWGWRLGVRKGDFGKTTDWRRWSPQMQAYCESDVLTSLSLWRLIEAEA